MQSVQHRGTRDDMLCAVAVRYMKRECCNTHLVVLAIRQYQATPKAALLFCGLLNRLFPASREVPL